MTIWAVAAMTLAVRGQQIPVVNFDVRAAKGLMVSPIFEGWYQLDGTTYALFGYYNRNSEEVIDIPIGPDNKVEPGPVDQGQPTRFVPGQNYGVFAVAIPKDKPKTEITWTLTANGQTLAIPGTLHQEYFVSPMRDDGGVNPGNTPPLLKLESAGPSAKGPLGLTISRTATVSRPLTLEVWASDDDPPLGERKRPSGAPIPARAAEGPKGPKGPTVTWSLYRGTGKVTFSNPSPPLEQGKAQTTVTFGAPGEYMLRVLAFEARSGTKCCWTNGYVKVTVAGGSSDR